MLSSQSRARGRALFSRILHGRTLKTSPVDVGASRNRLSETLAAIDGLDPQTPIEKRLEKSLRRAVQMLENLHEHAAVTESSIASAWAQIEDLREAMDYVRELRALRRDLEVGEAGSGQIDDGRGMQG